MKYNEKRVDLFTVRSPPPVRYYKIFRSVNKIAQVQLITGTVVHTIHLKMNLDTVLAYAFLLGKYLKSTNPAIIDVVALFSALLKRKKDLVVDFRTPFPLELAWLGHKTLASLAHSTQKILPNVNLVLTPNERMAAFCKELGATSVQIIPNYPNKSFKPTIESEKWKSKHCLFPEDRVALFTGGVRLREIYGLDLLLNSWKLVETMEPSNVLVILGDESIEYIKRKRHSLNIHRLLLPGIVSPNDVVNWINCANVCLAPRTPGFPRYYYDDKDSTKISEYAALEKPIVAAGYAPSSQYLLVSQTPEDFAEGIIKGVHGKINTPKPHYWEENECMMLKVLEEFWFS